MKTNLGALALTLSAPIAAQTPPAADPHAAHHSPAQSMDHSQHRQTKHDCKECCEKMHDKDGKMECKDKAPEPKAAESSNGHGGHAS